MGKGKNLKRAKKTQLGKIPETIVKTFLRQCLVNGRGNVQVVLLLTPTLTTYYPLPITLESLFLCAFICHTLKAPSLDLKEKKCNPNNIQYILDNLKLAVEDSWFLKSVHN